MNVKIDCWMPMDFDPYDGLIISSNAIAVDYKDDDTEHEIANMKFYQVDFENIVMVEENPFVTFDAITQQLMEIYSTFYKGDQLSKKLISNISCNGENMLHIDCLKVKKEYRHKGIGRIVIDRVIRSFRGWNMVVIKPFPLQLCDNTKEDYSDLPKKGAMKKLVNYYESIGFKKFSSQYYYLFIEEYLAKNPLPI